jgi:uncharacterized membrane protein
MNDSEPRTQSSPPAGPADAAALAVAATPGRLALLRDAGTLSPATLRALIASATAPPDAPRWRRFLDVLLLSLGLGLVLVGVIYFFAFNWQDLGRLSKLGLLWLVLLIAALAGWRLDPRGLGGRLALLAATVLTGALLATQGQAYQSSADPWWLFAWWALISLPWVIAARFWPLWLLWLALLNLALGLWWSTQAIPFDTLFDAQRFYGQVLTIAVLNAGLLALWERFGARLATPPPAPGRWLPRLLALATYVALLVGIVRWIAEGFEDWATLLEPAQRGGLVAAVLWLAFVAAILLVYRRLRPDLVILAETAGAIMVVTTLLLLRVLLGNERTFQDDTAVALRMLTIGAALLAQAVLAVAWLRGEHRRMVHSDGAGDRSATAPPPAPPPDPDVPAPEAEIRP